MFIFGREGVSECQPRRPIDTIEGRRFTEEPVRTKLDGPHEHFIRQITVIKFVKGVLETIHQRTMWPSVGFCVRPCQSVSALIEPSSCFMLVDQHVVTADCEPGDSLAGINIDQIVSQVKEIVGLFQIHQNGDVKWKARRVIWVCKKRGVVTETRSDGRP